MEYGIAPLDPKLSELCDRVWHGVRSRWSAGFAIEELEIYIADDLWSLVLRWRESSGIIEKHVDPDGIKVFLMGRPVHVDRTLNDGQARLRYELVV